VSVLPFIHVAPALADSDSELLVANLEGFKLALGSVGPGELSGIVDRDLPG
jgi:hypothetical protein